MTLLNERPDLLPPGPEVRPRQQLAESRPSNPVVAWAVFGVLCLAVITYSWGDWLLSGDAHPTPDGPDTQPTWMYVGVRIMEALSVSIFFVGAYFFGYKQWKKNRRLSLDGLLILGFTTVFMLQDPWENYQGITYSYNTEFVNLGCPQCHAPGWLSPGGSGEHQFAEPILFVGFMYGGIIFLGAVLCGWFMKQAKRRWPRLTPLQLFGVGFLSMVALDIAIEVPVARLGGWVWWYGDNMPLTFFPGNYYQLPMLEIILWSFCWTLYGSFRYFLNDRGETIAERGAHRLGLGAKTTTFVRFLAIAGALNAIMLFSYNTPYGWIATHYKGETPPSICDKSYLNNGMAGKGTNTACPSATTPLPVGDDSVRIDPGGNVFDPAKQALDPHPEHN